MVFNIFDKPEFTVSPDGSVQSFKYDNRGNLIENRQYAGAQPDYVAALQPYGLGWLSALVIRARFFLLAIDLPGFSTLIAIAKPVRSESHVAVTSRV